MKKLPRQRVDHAVVAQGLAPNIAQAAALIMAGKIMIGEQKALKSGDLVASDVSLRLLGGTPNPYVSRGGLKLAGALHDLRIDVKMLNCADIGASTGGFTDCLLQHGAARVAAVDVGHGLLAEKLRRDARVLVLEKVNAKHLTAQSFPWPVDLIVMDVSFIGARNVLPMLVPLLQPDGQLLILVKPQFELQHNQVGKGGVVHDDDLRWLAVDHVRKAAEQLDLVWVAHAESQVHGPAGNREIFVLLRQTPLLR